MTSKLLCKSWNILNSKLGCKLAETSVCNVYSTQYLESSANILVIWFSKWTTMITQSMIGSMHIFVDSPATQHAAE